MLQDRAGPPQLQQKAALGTCKLPALPGPMAVSHPHSQQFAITSSKSSADVYMDIPPRLLREGEKNHLSAAGVSAYSFPQLSLLTPM